jgi:hypothetical protein
MRTACLGLLLAAIATPTLARAEGAAPPPIALKVGEALVLSRAGLLIFPGNSPICDDPKVAVGELTPQGLAFRGVGPGSTLCSAMHGHEVSGRRVFKVTVSP